MCPSAPVSILFDEEKGASLRNWLLASSPSSVKSFRLNRLFNAKSRRCFDVAVDHGFFNEYGFLAGIEDLPGAIRTLVAAGPDAIQLTVGQARLLQDVPGREKPSLVLRTGRGERLRQGASAPVIQPHD